VISQITTLSTGNDGDLKKLKDFLRHEQESLKANAVHVDQALQVLDPMQNTLGIAFLLAAQLSASAMVDARATFTYIGNFLKVADEHQVKKAAVPVNIVCKSYAQMAIDGGQHMTLRSIAPLRCALQKLRPDAETLTPVHTEFLRVCLKANAPHLAGPVLDQAIFDISLTNSNCTHMTAQSFLCYFYYGAVVRISMKNFTSAMRLLLVALTCPASCLSAIQADAYKKYVLLSLKVHGELLSLPVYASHIVQRYTKSPSYVLDIAEAFKQGDVAGLRRAAEEKAQQIEADQNTGLVKQVIASLRRHKVRTLTKTYLTMSIIEICGEIGFEEPDAVVAEVEDLLFDMISCGEINASIDQSTGNVSFEDDLGDAGMGPEMGEKLQDQMAQILELATRVAAFEREVVSSEQYIRKTAVLEGDRSGASLPLGNFDFMDM